MKGNNMKDKIKLLLNDIKDPKLKTELKKDFKRLFELKAKKAIAEDKDVVFMNIQSDIYKFIRDIQQRMSNNGQRHIVESYAIIFVILWAEFQAFISFLEEHRKQSMQEEVEHFKYKIQQVIDGKGPPPTRLN
jgi:hypothetical protein